MSDEVTPQKLRQSLRHRVEVIAFGIAYVGTLDRIDPKAGTIRIKDRDNYAVLEIERIESFRQIN